MGEKILVIDDNDTDRQKAVRILEKEGYLALDADSGEAAIWILSQNPDVRVILMDIYMPDMDGMDTLKKIKELFSVENMKIIFVSSLNDKKAVVKAVSLGAFDYLVKPYRPEELLEHVSLAIADPASVDWDALLNEAKSKMEKLSASRRTL